MQSLDRTCSGTHRDGWRTNAVAKQLGIDPAYYYRAGPWDEKDLGSLFDANKAWANKMRGLGFFEGREKGHAPKILWIGCSDA